MGNLADKPSKGSQTNVNNDMLTGAFKPALGYVTGGGDMMGSLLGVGGLPQQTAALENFANSGGMKFLQEQGMRGIESSQAAKGLLQSGSTLKAMDKYNNGLASTYLNQFMQNLGQYANIGLGAGGILAESGVQKKEKGAKKGILSTGADAAAAAAAAAA